MPVWRLQRFLAAAGFGSRRKCEELIEAGRVQVDGKVAVLGTKVDLEAPTFVRWQPNPGARVIQRASQRNNSEVR